MTEADWWSCQDPDRMLDLLRRRASSWLTSLFARSTLLSRKALSRKLRLFACACVRQVWGLLAVETCRYAVEVAERYADGLASEEELADEDRATMHAGVPGEAFGPADCAASITVYPQSAFAKPHGGAQFPAFGAARFAAEASPDEAAARAVQADLLRDLFGNPFRAAPTLEPSLFRWNGGAVVQLAQAAYEERILPEGHLDRARLVVLADVLEEAGAPEEVQAHLRAPDPHWRGCWAVDLLLGKS